MHLFDYSILQYISATEVANIDKKFEKLLHHFNLIITKRKNKQHKITIM